MQHVKAYFPATYAAAWCFVCSIMALLKADFCFDKKNCVYEELGGFFTQKGRVTGRFDVRVSLVKRPDKKLNQE